MGVGIDEAGGYATASGIDYGCAGWDLRSEFGVFTDGSNATAFDEHRGVVDDAGFVEFFTGARTCGSGESDELTYVYEC